MRTRNEVGLIIQYSWSKIEKETKINMVRSQVTHFKFLHPVSSGLKAMTIYVQLRNSAIYDKNID